VGTIVGYYCIFAWFLEPIGESFFLLLKFLVRTILVGIGSIQKGTLEELIFYCGQVVNAWVNKVGLFNYDILLFTFSMVAAIERCRIEG